MPQPRREILKLSVGLSDSREKISVTADPADRGCALSRSHPWLAAFRIGKGAGIGVFAGIRLRSSPEVFTQGRDSQFRRV